MSESACVRASDSLSDVEEQSITKAVDGWTTDVRPEAINYVMAARWRHAAGDGPRLALQRRHLIVLQASAAIYKVVGGAPFLPSARAADRRSTCGVQRAPLCVDSLWRRLRQLRVANIVTLTAKQLTAARSATIAPKSFSKHLQSAYPLLW